MYVSECVYIYIYRESAGCSSLLLITDIIEIVFINMINGTHFR